MSVEIHYKCPTCSATGYVPSVSVDPENICKHCGGTGYDDWGHLEYDLDEKFNDLSDKVDNCLDKLDDILERLSE